MRNKSVISVLVLLSFWNFGIAQNNSFVFGQLVDSLTLRPLAFASIQLVDKENDNMIAAGITDTTGYFGLKVTAIPCAVVRFSYIGYERKDMNINMSSKRKCDLGSIKLSPFPEMLNEVTVTAHETYTMLIDRNVFVPDSISISQSVTSLDLLNHVPELKIDRVNKSISILGKSTLVLVNGVLREGLDISTIPKEDVESIEVIHNPSSKYETEFDGIVNVVLKKEPTTGFMSLAEINQLFPNKRTEGLVLLQYSTKKSRLYLNYNLNRWKIVSENMLQRNKVLNSDSSYFVSSSLHHPLEISQSVRFGVDYMPDEKTFFNFYAKLDVDDKVAKDSLNTNWFGMSPRLDYSIGFDTSAYFFQNYSLFFKREFEGCLQKISSDITCYSMKSDTKLHYHDRYFGLKFPDVYRFQKDSGHKTSLNSHFDLSFLFSERHRLETGVCCYYQDFKDSFLDGLDTTSFRFREAKPSCYADYYGNIGKWNIKVGTCYEYHSRNASDSLSIQGHFLPSVRLSYRLSNGFVGLNYNRRSISPSIWSLNPQVVMQDSLTYSLGNPYLSPQINDVFELNCRIGAGYGVLAASLFYLSSENVIRNVFYMVNNITYIKPFNASSFKQYGMKASATVSLFEESLDISADARFQQDSFVFDGQRNEGFIWGTSVSIDYYFPWNLFAGMSFEYYNKQLLPQGFMKGIPQIDMVYLQKSFHEGRGSVMIAYQNLFESEYLTHVEYEGIAQEETSFVGSHGVFVRLNYWLSKGKQSKEISRMDYFEHDVK